MTNPSDALTPEELAVAVTIRPLGGGWVVCRGEQPLRSFGSARLANAYARRELDGCGQPEGHQHACPPQVLNKGRSR